MRGIGVMISALTWFAAAPAAHGFGTIKGLGQNAEHGRITRLAISCETRQSPHCLGPATLHVLIGAHEDGGALGVPDLSPMAFQKSAHCDGGDWLAAGGYAHPKDEARQALGDCRAWIDSSLNEAVAAAKDLVADDGRLVEGEVGMDCRFLPTFRGGAKCRVLKDLGLALHAAQDFYSHTNWADLADPARPVNAANPPGLGHDGPAPWLSLRGEAAFPDGLISGCFTALPEALFCNDGEGGRVKHLNLNKDEGVIEPKPRAGTTPRGEVQGNFARAVGAAIADTRDKWALLRERLVVTYGPARGAAMACAISHDNPARDC